MRPTHRRYPQGRLLATITILVATAVAGRFAAWPSSAVGPGSSGDLIADRVLGQSSFSTNAHGHRDGSMLDTPMSIAIDRNSKPAHLYLSDTANSRVMGWLDVASFKNGQAADLVIGQADFASDLCNSGMPFMPAASTLCGPAGVAVGPNGDLYVADSGNLRVLEFASPFAACQSFPCVGGAAIRVFGKAGDFTAVNCPLSEQDCLEPSGAALDSAGNLYIADSCRVLEYDAPFGSPPIPQRVFGQDGNLMTNLCDGGTEPGDINGVGPDSLFNAVSVRVDRSDNVWVADLGNCRVLEYFSPLKKTTPGTGDTDADAVVGQSDFTSTCGGPIPQGQAGLGGPNDMAVDSLGNLFIVDGILNRVMEYDNAPLFSCGAFGCVRLSANRVIGQNSNFSAWVCNDVPADNGAPAPDDLCVPNAVAVDDLDNLYVIDSSNNRMLAYERPLVVATATATATRTATSTATRAATPTATPTPVNVTLIFTPKPVNFGTIVENTTAVKTLTIKNSSAKRTGSPVMIKLETAALPFGLSSQCVMTLAPGKSCTAKVTFNPHDAKPHQGTLMVFDDAIDSPQAVTLNGTGKMPKKK